MNILYTDVTQPTSVRNKPGYIRTVANPSCVAGFASNQETHDWNDHMKSKFLEDLVLLLGLYVVQHKPSLGQSLL